MSDEISDVNHSCINTTKIALLETRVDSLEKEQHKAEEFRSLYHEEREARIRHDTELDGKVDRMDKKIDKLVSRQEEIDNKPNKLIDKIKENSIWCVIAALIGAALMKVFGI